jgi:hypothetical protein
MRYLIFSIVALIMFFVVGCGPALSLHPLYTDKDVIFNPALVGRWGEGGDDNWIFRQKDDNIYNVTLKFTSSSSSNDSLVLEGRLLQLGNDMFMDVTSKESDVENLLAIPVHGFLRLSLEGDSLGIAYLDDSWLEKNSDLIKHEVVDKHGILLTASTKELQDFVLKHAEDKEAFEMEWYRRQ